MNADAFRAKAARRGMGPVAETAWAPETVNPPHAHDFAAMLLRAYRAASACVWAALEQLGITARD